MATVHGSGNQSSGSTKRQGYTRAHRQLVYDVCAPNGQYVQLDAQQSVQSIIRTVMCTPANIGGTDPMRVRHHGLDTKKASRRYAAAVRNTRVK